MSNSSSRTPSPPKTPSSLSFPQKTNTLMVTQIPKEFFVGVVLDALRDHFATYGEINRWVPLTGFGRIIVVYKSEDDAERAKLDCDPVVIDASHDREEIILRVYRADPNPLVIDSMTSQIPEGNYLAPPAIEKNFLISPPGSPPIGWEPIKEDPPNPTPLANDIIAALKKLHLRTKRSSLEVLLDPEEGAGVGVYVEDYDADEGGVDDDGDVMIKEENWIYGETNPARMKWKPVATAMPPIHSVLTA